MFVKKAAYMESSVEDPAIETAEEAKEPAEADINELCKDMFSKMATYLTGELTATSEDYKLLENMNKLTSLKYLEMKDIAINISRNLKDLNQKYADLQPYLEQINLIEEQVAALEQAAYKLDAYSKKLGLQGDTGRRCVSRENKDPAGEARLGLDCLSSAAIVQRLCDHESSGDLETGMACSSRTEEKSQQEHCQSAETNSFAITCHILKKGDVAGGSNSRPRRLEAVRRNRKYEEI
ncbi:hypothetical protein IHE44_0001662 [Lamprotornis superbus]|uniref:Biogenesis of lysosome-related organelles complex 1 subunit 2 n=14 Tax=Passeriformes TaxID=9126 RepID=A0A835NS84_9PASS|nr:hypothetical protein IHE44_0001662 [Lamprotornis superbus]